jgi:hypothetical protein
MAENHWILGITSPLMDVEALECVALWATVQRVSCNEDLEDVFTWSCSKSGRYTAKATYDHISREGTQFPLSDGIWKSKATPRCKDFMWRTMKSRLWTSDRRFRHGL